MAARLLENIRNLEAMVIRRRRYIFLLTHSVYQAVFHINIFSEWVIGDVLMGYTSINLDV